MSEVERLVSWRRGHPLRQTRRISATVCCEVTGDARPAFHMREPTEGSPWWLRS
jgi:hypothetical protein